VAGNELVGVVVGGDDEVEPRGPELELVVVEQDFVDLLAVVPLGRS
jgi:hypothetical protein